MSDLEKELDLGGAVVLTGLPRVGRTTLISSLKKHTSNDTLELTGRDCGGFNLNTDLSALTGRLIIIDGVSTEHVEHVAEIIRKCHEQMPSASKFVLISRNAKVEQMFNELLTGILRTVELPPIQRMDLVAGNIQLAAASSRPLNEAPQAELVNSKGVDQEVLWLRGGLPESLYSESDATSFEWRNNYLRSYLDNDFSRWGIDASDRLKDVFQYIANDSGQLFDEIKCSRALSVPKDSVRRSLDLLVRSSLVRRLPNLPAKTASGMKNMPKVYVRDSGLLHAALGIESVNGLFRSSDSVRGSSWESFALETLINSVRGRAEPMFFREKDNELDLVLLFPGQRFVAVECKFSADKRPTKGFSVACELIGAEERFVVHSGEKDIQLFNETPRRTLLSALNFLSTEQTY